MLDVRPLSPPAAPPTLSQILLVGDSGVGKSSLLLRFTSGEFEEASVPTIGKEKGRRARERETQPPLISFSILSLFHPRRRLPPQIPGAPGQAPEADHLGHGGPGAVPHADVVLLPRRAGDHFWYERDERGKRRGGRGRGLAPSGHASSPVKACARVCRGWR